MNESVSIKEGGLTRKFSPVGMVRINSTDGTQSTWVPKDDVTTGTLYATENGIYIASEDGYDAYDEVVIRVTDDSEWADVYPDNYGTWDEATYEAYLEDPESFKELFNDEDKWKEEDLGESLDYKYGGNGISGIDPNTGEPVSYNLDENGYLEEEILPDSIHITIKPRKLEYKEGEKIDYSGIHVYLMDAENHLFTNERYPTGEIPFNELLMVIKTARVVETEGPKKVATKGTDLTGDVFMNTVYEDMIWSVYTDPDTRVIGIVGDHPSIYAFSGGGTIVDYVWVATTPWTVHLARNKIGINSYDSFISGSLVQYGDSYYYIHHDASSGYRRMNDLAVSDRQWNPEEAAMTSHKCPKLTEQLLPVDWIRSDGKVLEDTFVIYVEEDSNGGLGTGIGGSVQVSGNSSHIGGNF